MNETDRVKASALKERIGKNKNEYANLSSELRKIISPYIDRWLSKVGREYIDGWTLLRNYRIDFENNSIELWLENKHGEEPNGVLDHDFLLDRRTELSYEIDMNVEFPLEYYAKSINTKV
jgi:hypothetical protein